MAIPAFDGTVRLDNLALDGNLTVAGSASFGTASTFDVTSYGAEGDGATDDTSAIQDAFDAAKVDGGIVFFPVGDYLVTSTIDVTDVRGLIVRGCGGQFGDNGTQIKATFGSAADLFDVSNTNKCRWQDFHILADGVDACFYSENNSGDVTPSANIYENIRIQDTGSGYDRGWEFSAAGTAGNANNDLNVFRDCHCEQPTEEGWLIGHNQSKTHNYYDCSSSGGNHIINSSGSYRWYGGAGGGATTAAAFWQVGVVDNLLISGFNLETCDRLFEQSGDNTNGFPITIRDGRFATNGLNADDVVIKIRHPGPVIVDGVIFGGGSPVEIQHNYGGNDPGAHLRVSNCHFNDNGPGDSPFNIKLGDGNNDIEIHGNTYSGGSGAVDGVGAITDQDATPSVLGGRLFKTANTASTTITGFDDGHFGQEIRVIIGDGNTTVDFTGTNLKGNGGADWSPADGDHMTCVFDGTDWYCDVSDNTA